MKRNISTKNSIFTNKIYNLSLPTNILRTSVDWVKDF